ncbi:MAG TPA: exosortase K [Kofleriaceae bacterium]|nr:exosortase K [Kofleriaceae bacterium]
MTKLALFVVVACIVIAGKTYYRHATADDLAFLLAPTAMLVSAATDTHFTRERGVGWIDRDAAFEIVPECAGMHFLLCALVALAIASLPALTSWSAVARQLAFAIVGAYVATLVVNTLRIAIAVRMHQHELGGADAHRLEGTAIYFGGLCALYAFARGRHEAKTA